mmetsp:Transcript_1504/g.2653  ORF Transcript_1504/g.2653 Transcript_1504/m.2653 type:complete len:113 (-) Transcript_1504:146-484(-)
MMIPTGCVEVSRAGDLGAKYIIHAVGPNMNDPSQLGLDRGQLLAYAIKNALERAEELGCRSISIPAIATGSFGFPKNQCAQIMFQCIIKFGTEKLMNDEETTVKFIRLINND